MAFLPGAASGAIVAGMGVWTLAREDHTRALVIGVGGVVLGVGAVIYYVTLAVKLRRRQRFR